MNTITEQIADALRACLPWVQVPDDMTNLPETAREALAAYDAQRAAPATFRDSGCFVGGLHIELNPETDKPDNPEAFGYALQSNGTRICDGLEEEHARRIVACVNACAGIPAEQLENAR